MLAIEILKLLIGSVAACCLIDIGYTLTQMYNRMPKPPAKDDDFEPSDYCPKCEEDDLED
jgi:hypothetical protein